MFASKPGEAPIHLVPTNCANWRSSTWLTSEETQQFYKNQTWCSCTNNQNGKNDSRESRTITQRENRRKKKTNYKLHFGKKWLVYIQCFSSKLGHLKCFTRQHSSIHTHLNTGVIEHSHMFSILLIWILQGPRNKLLTFPSLDLNALPTEPQPTAEHLACDSLQETCWIIMFQNDLELIQK